jgi:RND family efflux transporter MFP subunit
VRHAEAGRTRADASYGRWQSEYARIRRLLPSGATDAQTHDQTYDQLKSAEAARDESRTSIELATAARAESAAQRDQAGVNVRVAEGKRKVAEADRERTAAVLQYARITAPFDGVVTRRGVDTGHFVQPSPGGSNPGVPLFVVVRTDPLRIFVDVPETAAAAVRDGAPARVRVQALQEEEFAGRVTRSSWALDNQTRTLRVQIDLPNKDGRLRPGMYASAALTVERPGALVLPAAALLVNEDQPTVLRVEDGKAVRTPVKLGARQGSLVEVIKKQAKPVRRGEPVVWESFTGREEIVVANPSALADGQAVGVRAGK